VIWSRQSLTGWETATYFVAVVEVDGKPKEVGEHKAVEEKEEGDAGNGSLAERGVEKDATTSDGFGLRAQSLQAKDK